MGTAGDSAGKVPPQLAKQLAQDVKKSSLYKPFESFPEAIGPAERSRLEAQAEKTIKGSIVPALERLHHFIAETIAKGGGSTPKAWVKSSGFTRTRTRNSDDSASRSTVPAGWSSTRECTQWAGPEKRQSII